MQVRSERFSSHQFVSETVPSVAVKHKVSVEECGVQNRMCVLCLLNQQFVTKSDLFSVQSVEAVILCCVV